MRIVVPGTPQGKGRARFGNGRTYTPAKTVAYEGLIAFAGQQVMGNKIPLTGPVRVTVEAYFPIPASWSKKKREAAVWHTGKPDGDNILKAVGDGLNGIVWRDDSAVSAAALTKLYSDTPRLEIQVEALA